MKLFGSKQKQAVTVTVEPVQTKPGSTVQAMIHITGGPDDKARGAVARLVRHQHWSAQTTDSDGDKQASRRSDAVVAAEVVLAAAGEPIAEGDHPAVFVVPDDAVHSAAGAVEWAVEVEIDRRMAGDAKGHAPLTVLAPAERNTDHAMDDPTASGAPPFHVDLHRRTVRPGDRVTGTVVVRSEDDLSLKYLAVDLQRVRIDIEGGKLLKFVVHASPCTLAEGLAMPGGATKDYPFELTLPIDAVPTLRGPHTHFTWLVVASGINGRFKQNHSMSTQIQVHNDPEAAR